MKRERNERKSGTRDKGERGEEGGIERGNKEFGGEVQRMENEGV